MKQLALARLKHDEFNATHTLNTAHQPFAHLQSIAAPTQIRPPTSNKNHHNHATLQLSRIIGNKALQRMLAPPTVQRSFWEDVTDTVDAATDWISDATETPAQPAWENEAQPDDSDVSEEVLEHGNDPEFTDAVDADLDTAPDQTSYGSWFDSYFSDTQSEQQEPLNDDSQTDVLANARIDPCKDIELELENIQPRIEELFDLSQNMLPAVESAQKEYEDLKKSAPGSAQTQAAKERYDQMLAQYNEVVDQCLQLMAYRDQLRADLAACKEDEKKKMPKGFPCC